MVKKCTEDELQSLSFGAHVLRRDYLAPWRVQEQRNREMLSHALNLRDTIVFVGAGCSIPLKYPSWEDLATLRAIPAARKTVAETNGISDDLRSRCERKLRELEERIVGGNERKATKRRLNRRQSERKLPSADLTSILGACERICYHCGAASEFRKEIAKLFRLKQRENRDFTSAYALLANLPVHRFITSNYDCELEAALVKKWALRDEDYNYEAKNFGKKSFTQTAKYDEQLAMFSMAFAGYERRVFHCHGWHHEPDSMVLTEDDYQRWYFRDQAIGGSYRQTIDLIFNSNPILFVGFSLTDDDLLVPLRFLSAVEGARKYSRPIFALLERSSVNGEGRFEQLYERYGIHVLSYDAPIQTPEGRAEAMCQAIAGIAERCRIHRKEWLEKPAFKSVERNRGKVLLHYDYGQQLLDLHESTSDKRQENAFWPGPHKAKVIWIVGPSGTGKSWDAIRRLHRLQGAAKFQGFAFWSFRYCNDAMSGIERILRFMGAEPGPAEYLFDQLLEQLRTKYFFVVLDGIERFLHQSTSGTAVVAVNSSCHRFFLRLADSKARRKSALVLTSRLLPTLFESFISRSDRKPNRGITVLQAKGFNSKQIESILRGNSLGKEASTIAEQLCAWFRGHRYGVTLAAEWLKQQEFSQLEYEMAEADPEHRVSKMIGLALRALRETATREPDTIGNYAYRLIERLAIFVEPVAEDVASACLETNDGKDFNAALKLLKDRKLLFEVLDCDKQTRYLVHPSTREYIFHHDHHSSPADLPSFGLSGFTSASATIYPGDRQSAGKRTVLSLCESLTRVVSKQDSPIDLRQRIAFCRAAFGVVRSRMVATTVTRWSRYDEYLRLLVSLLDAVRYLSPRRNGSKTAANAGLEFRKDQSNAALYADEIAWLYNEAGLAYYGEGSMSDAIAVWEQSYEINRLLDGEGNGHHVFQSLCNLGGAYIHFGRLQKAESYLHKAIEMGRKLGEDDHTARIQIYLALLCHLRGNIGEANEKYRIVSRKLHDLGNMRGHSIALRHHADLLLRQEVTRSEAREMIQTSKAVAETNSYHDLVAYSRLSYGHLHRVDGKFADAIREYRVALDLARTMGLRRLEAEAQSELARVDLDLGDSQVARRRAMKALQIANEHLLGLRQTHCLVILGKATINAGERELGIHYLRYAKRLADEQEYQLRAAEAEAALYEIGEPVDNSGVETTSAA
jgi:tetratricopeptide (TPR) repeat protein